MLWRPKGSGPNRFGPLVPLKTPNIRKKSKLPIGRNLNRIHQPDMSRSCRRFTPIGMSPTTSRINHNNAISPAVASSIGPYEAGGTFGGSILPNSKRGPQITAHSTKIPNPKQLAVNASSKAEEQPTP